MSEQQNNDKPLGKSPYAKKGKRPYRYETVEQIDAARATGNARLERRAIENFNDSIQREHKWNPSWRKR